MSLTLEQKIYFRDQFRSARASALQDAEGFQEILFTLERLGSYLHKAGKSLYDYYPYITALAEASPLAIEIPEKWQERHSQFSVLYDAVKTGRNDALHQGAIARSLTEHAIQIALIIEDALMQNVKSISAYMIRDVTCASLWQPVSFARQIMLMHSFSYLPIKNGDTWYLLSDTNIAAYLLDLSKKKRDEALATSIEAAIKDRLEIEIAKTTTIYTTAVEAIKEISDFNGKPLLVFATADDKKERLLGIATAFDLL
jgi:hypothetical protein